MAWLLHTTRDDDNILGVTFTKKAAGEMQTRLQSMRQSSTESTAADPYAQYYDSSPEEENDVARRVTLGTFHAVCAKVLKYQGSLLSTLPSVQADMGNDNVVNLDAGFTIVDPSEQQSHLKSILETQQIDLKDKDKYFPPLTVQQVLKALSFCKGEFTYGRNPFLLPEGQDELKPALQVAQQVYYPYRRDMLQTNCLDFDDLIYLTRELLSTQPSVRQRLQSYWTHILVDEFQDTSQHQMDIIKLLTTSSLFVVGDADQSIYSWRGAHASSLANFTNEFADFGRVETVYLMENYRSTANIVRAAQKVITVQSASEEDKLRQRMVPQKEKGPPPRIVACGDGKAEAQFVVNTVKEMVQAGHDTDKKIAFIYRTNAQSRQLEEACVQASIPYVIWGSATSFYKRLEIKDCLCFLRWLYNGRDREAMMRAMKTPRRGIGETALREFDAYCLGVGEEWDAGNFTGTRPSPLDIICSLGGDHQYMSMPVADIPPPETSIGSRSLKPLGAFGAQLATARKQTDKKTVDELLVYVIQEFKLMPYLEKLSKSDEEFTERKQNVDELIIAARRYSEDGPSTLQIPTNSDDLLAVSSCPLGNFLEDVALVTDIADSKSASSPDGRLVVNMMTIHASKGMEFDTVFLVGLEEGTVPSFQAILKGEESVVYREERRLVYVAMTRAKNNLIMSWRKEAIVFTPKGISYVQKERSNFLDVFSKPKPTTAATPKAAGKKKSRWVPGTSRALQGTNSVYNDSTRRRTIHSDAGRSSPDYADFKPMKKTTTRMSSTGKTKPRAPAAAYSVNPRLAKTSVVEKKKMNPSNRKSSVAKKSTRKNAEKILPEVSWFFPTGSKVKHSRHGVGVVVEAGAPLPRTHNVHVQFSSGETMEFPIDGSDLSPV